jgi:hypothetical protein
MIISHQEGSMELIYVLDRGRMQRDLRRREAALREAAEEPPAAEPEPLVAQLREAAEESPAAEPEPLAAQYASKTRGWWECDFCGRSFHGYGRFFNHNCHEHD